MGAASTFLRRSQYSDGLWNYRNFSNGVPLEFVDTVKSRLVLKEVEPDWWILAAINLTQLPSNAVTDSKSGRKSGLDAAIPPKSIEYSSREVAPAPLLLAQLVQAHHGFLLHHAPSLSEMWKKHEDKRDLFCSLVHRYWAQFVWNWDILLHGNPAVDIYNATKLAIGGELGVGVGEEEWGSGEREVLEGFAGRTEGLVDLIVGRYGEAPAPSGGKEPNDTKLMQPPKASSPWMGNGENPRAEDGIIFSGIGGISRSSLAAVSQWMECIYRDGDAAYGISENPASLPRRRQKRRKHDRENSQRASSKQSKHRAGELHPRVRSPASKGVDLRRKAIENNATPAGIPPPLVSAVERSLDNAIAKADAKASEPGEDNNARSTAETNSAPAFTAEKMMKYLSLGYGTSWTLNPKGFSTENSSKGSRDTDLRSDKDGVDTAESPLETQLQELDPTPEASDEEERPFVQRLEESIGKFLIGLSGDLENTEFEDESNDERASDLAPQSPIHVREASNRIFLRTLLVKMSMSRFSTRTLEMPTFPQPGAGASEDDAGKGKTSAGASVDGAQSVNTHEKVQVAVYVHQPFVFVFLFQLHISNLTIPSFYRAIHHTLGPLQRSLLRSTDPQRWRERMIGCLYSPSQFSTQSGNEQDSDPATQDLSEIFDLIYDPTKSTVRTSIPNIPLPGSLAAEGLHQRQQNSRPITVSGSWYTLGIPTGSSSTEGSAKSSSTAALIKSDWTRVEALNVHTHILNIWVATRDKHAGITNALPNAEESERTIKTSRSWWIVWMNLLKPNQRKTESDSTMAKEAILVRRSRLERSSTSRETSQSRSDARSSSLAGKWLLREQPRSREVSGSSNAASAVGPASAKAVTEGMGLDAKKWVEALLQLSL